MVSLHSERTVEKTGSAAQMSVVWSSGPETGNWMRQHEDVLGVSDWSGAVKVELKWKTFGDKQDKSKLEDCSGKNRNPLQLK